LDPLDAMLKPGMPSRRRELFLRNTKRLTPEFARKVLEKADTLKASDPVEYGRLARFALSVVLLLPEGKATADVRSEAWAARGNHLRIQGNPKRALFSLEKALEHWSQGSKRPAMKARILEFRASAERSQREIGKCLSTLREALALRRRSGSRRAIGSVITQIGIALAYKGELEEAVHALYEAIRMCDRPADLRAAGVSLLWCLVELDRGEDAAAVLEGLKPVMLGEGADLLRLEWNRGRILGCLGAHDAADALLQEVANAYRKRNQGVEEVLVCLDQARIYFRAGRLEAVTLSVQRLVPILDRIGFADEALAARALAGAAGQMSVPAISQLILAVVVRSLSPRGRKASGAR
jgi:tetratricopeptide (TPR) repeat protein